MPLSLADVASCVVPAKGNGTNEANTVAKESRGDSYSTHTASLQFPFLPLE